MYSNPEDIEPLKKVNIINNNSDYRLLQNTQNMYKNVKSFNQINNQYNGKFTNFKTDYKDGEYHFQ